MHAVSERFFRDADVDPREETVTELESNGKIVIMDMVVLAAVNI